MKRSINTLKNMGSSLLVVASLATALSLSTTAQAGEWRTIPANACQSFNEGHVLGSEIIRFQSGIRYNNQGNHTGHAVICPLEVDNSNSPRNVEVWVNYKKVAGSSMSCTLFANHYYGSPQIARGISMPVTNTGSVYGNVTSFPGGGATVYCSMRENDQLFAINYKSE